MKIPYYWTRSFVYDNVYRKKDNRIPKISDVAIFMEIYHVIPILGLPNTSIIGCELYYENKSTSPLSYITPNIRYYLKLIQYIW